MSKLAITYYYTMMGGRMCDIEVHSSGKKALEHLEKIAHHYFQMPVIKKSQLKLSKNAGCRIGFPFRYVVARFLSSEEVVLWRTHGEDVWVNLETQKLIAPEPSIVEVEEN
ncbi:hypothetical protein HN39_01970 [Listeria monocytogenes]|uniref:hypothetical protein n=1 Tax=Listeria monocytogenes TaxID=1639 RepID=UPI0008689161|nr:hypothetical protein [Listeria monocytogenes]EAC4628477.1 hypothetical protein [Listeria monocytogenes]EAC6356330.1 hypothetical protein [Listeria monocytogenes]EAC7062859.1 hypothetical protein [Listeria monocytogenes]EAC7899139.1 hypothetical protein [Listeria monocytogenes]EAD7040762.1 hypothetical protein [Listeria monocytogenes]